MVPATHMSTPIRPSVRMHGMPSARVPFGTHAVKASVDGVVASFPGTHRCPAPQLVATFRSQQELVAPGNVRAVSVVLYVDVVPPPNACNAPPPYGR